MKSITFAIASALLLTACGGADDASRAEPAPQLETQSSAPQADRQTVDASKPAANESAARANTSQSQKTSTILKSADGVEELVWQDLMPDGEDAVLAQLYEDYYAQVQRDMEAGSQRLLDAQRESGSDDIDLTAMITEGSAADTMEQIGTFNVVEDLDGVKIRLPGYVVPLDFNAGGVHKEFLLVPYFGACLHTPPPPPNQIVFVTADPGAEISSIYDPVWVEGTMNTGKFESDTGDSAYKLTLSKIEKYDY